MKVITALLVILGIKTRFKNRTVKDLGCAGQWIEIVPELPKAMPQH